MRKLTFFHHEKILRVAGCRRLIAKVLRRKTAGVPTKLSADLQVKMRNSHSRENSSITLGGDVWPYSSQMSSPTTSPPNLLSRAMYRLKIIFGPTDGFVASSSEMEYKALLELTLLLGHMYLTGEASGEHFDFSWGAGLVFFYNLAHFCWVIIILSVFDARDFIILFSVGCDMERYKTAAKKQA